MARGVETAATATGWSVGAEAVDGTGEPVGVRAGFSFGAETVSGAGRSVGLRTGFSVDIEVVAGAGSCASCPSTTIRTSAGMAAPQTIPRQRAESHSIAANPADPGIADPSCSAGWRGQLPSLRRSLQAAHDDSLRTYVLL